MDTMDPVYGSGTLLLIAALAVAVLLVLIIVLRMHAFVALVLVSFGTAMGDTMQFYKDIALTSMPYGQSLAIVALGEFLRSYI